MRQIVYCSITTAPGGHSTGAIPAILRQAAPRNGLDGVTGLLYAEGDAFLQAIEGPDDSVADLLERLRQDDRHRDLRILVDRQIEHRDFGDWTMAYRDRRERIDAFDERLRVLLAGVSRATAEYFRALVPA